MTSYGAVIGSSVLGGRRQIETKEEEAKQPLWRVGRINKDQEGEGPLQQHQPVCRLRSTHGGKRGRVCFWDGM